MKTIPLSERKAATDAMNEVKQWLGAADYRDVAAKLGNYTSGTVAQVAKCERWTVDIYAELLRIGRAKKAGFDHLMGREAKKPVEVATTIVEPLTSRKTPENGSDEPLSGWEALANSDKPVTKPRTVRKPKAEAAAAPAAAAPAELLTLPKKRTPAKPKNLVVAQPVP